MLEYRKEKEKMKAFDVRFDGELKDIIVELSLDQAIKVANQKYPHTTDDDLMEVKENEYSKGKNIEYCDECQMFMIQLSEGGTYYPLYSTLFGKEPIIIDGKKISRTKDLTRVGNCNRINDDLYRR